MAEVKVTLKKSLIGRKQDQIKTCQALGLTRPGRTVVKTRNAAIDVMLNKVLH